MSKIVTVSGDDYIFSIINDKIYIFNGEGALIDKTENSIFINGETDEYYTLNNNKKRVNWL